MPSEATILEGPVTPAPLFAYRAVRGIFFASPDSSPEHDKENVDPTPVSSPQKLETMDARLQLTPSHKRKRDSGTAMLSPTKGILRTPGLATPRAKFLKDLNVKFKSVSPETIQQKPRAAETAKDTNKGASSSKESSHPLRTSKSMSDLEATKKEHKTAPRPPDNTTKSGVPPTSGTTTLSPGTIDAYMQQTEKEMKKLVRYGQKMREYARKKDAENVELRSMVERLQRENERLRRPMLSEAETKQGQNGSANSHEGAVQGHGRKTPGNLKQTRQESIAQRPPTTHPRNPSPSRRVSSTATRRVSSATTHHTPSSHQHPPASARTAKTVAHALPVRSSSNSAAASHTSANTSTDDKTKSNSTAPASSANPVGPPITGTSSTRLAPDRLAAARERLRLRVEARKSSVEHHEHQDDQHDSLTARWQHHTRQHKNTPPARLQQQEGILIDIETDDDADADGLLTDGKPVGDRNLQGGSAAASQTQTAGSQSREQSVLDWANL